LFPAAVACLLDDRQALTPYLRFPREHWQRVRHSNFIERTFGESRRRVKVIGRLPGEASCTKLVWAEIEAVADRDQLAAAVETVDELVPGDEDDQGPKRAELIKRFTTVRSLWPALVDTLPLVATDPGRGVLAAVWALPGLFGRKKVAVAEIDEALLEGSWRRLVQGPDIEAGLVNWQAYTLAVAEGLHQALRRRDTFVIGTGRWGDPRAKLLDDEEWAAEKPKVLAALQLPAEPQDHLASVARELDDAYPGVAARPPGQRAGDDRRRPRARRQAGRPRRAGLAGRAAGPGRRHDAPGRPAGADLGGPCLDRLLGRLHPYLRGERPDG
jgi:hypothetical protein